MARAPEFDVKKAQDIIFKPNPGPQTEFLAASEQEVLYGGPFPLETQVLTPSGLVEIGSLEVGDKVFNRFGEIVSICDIPFQGYEDCVEITFKDGSTVESSEGHVWLVGSADYRKTKEEFREFRAKDLKENYHYIPLTAPVKFPERDVLLDPYFVGAMLGDGCLTKRCRMTLTGIDTEIVDHMKLPEGYSAKKVKGNIQWKFTQGQYGGKKDKRSVIWEEFKRLGLTGKTAEDKFIPDLYLFNSIEVRLATLQGLMDTDGCVRVRSEGGQRELKFTTISEKLKDGVVFLAQSLGYRVSVSEEMVLSKTYRVYLFASDICPFRLSRKAEIFHKGSSGYKTNYITSVKKTSRKLVRCITTDHPDHTFLLKNCIVTKNSAGGGKSFAMLADPLRNMNNPDFKGLLVRRTTEELRELISVSQRLYPQAVPGIVWSERKSAWTTPTGGNLWMSYLDKESDVTKYQGQAFCWIGFDELTQWATPYNWNYLRSRLRTTRGSGLKLYQRCTSNPGGLGHCVPFGEVLTKDGWVDIRDIKAGDTVVSVNKDLTQEYTLVSDVIEEEYDGLMVSRKDQMVFTENHRLPYIKSDNSLEIRPFYALPGQCNVPRAAFKNRYFTCKDYFEVPKFKTRALRLQQPNKILWSDYCELMGWFLSEGHTLDRDKEFGISQVKDYNRENIKNLLDRCEFRYRESSTGFQVSSPKWWNYFKQFGKCRDKFIPRDIMDSIFLRHFFEALMKGDGHWVSDTSGQYYTVSRQLADDVCEVCVRLGYTVRLSSRQRKDREGLSYEVYFDKRGKTELNTGNHVYNVDTESSRINCTKSHFKGKVYCITVPGTETFFIRQNGYVWISGNSWVKKTFIDPAPPNTSFHATDPETGEVLTWPKGHSREGQPLFKRRFIPATLFDNPYLADDGMYEANLLSLPEVERKRLLEGNWDVAEGAAFPEFNRTIHVVEPYEIPRSWIKFRACDYGYGSWTAVLWFAIVPFSDQLVVYRELYVSKVLAVDLAAMILDIEQGEKLSYGVLDSSLWHRRGDPGPSLAEQMIRVGCRWRPSDRSKGSRIAGKNEVHRRLQVDEFTQEPRLVIFNTCKNLISHIPSIPLDKDNPEDVDTHFQHDHSYDALRYGIMSRPRSTIFDVGTNFSRDEYTPSDSTFGY